MEPQINEICNWYVLYTLPNYEKKVNFILQKNKILTFLPLYKSKRRWSDRKKIVEVPLFSNYIFIKTTPADRYKALDTFGVKCFLNYDGRPVLVQDNEINNIRRLNECTSLDIEPKLVEVIMLESAKDHLKIW
jgi:transcription antitermination factor NusG